MKNSDQSLRVLAVLLAVPVVAFFAAAAIEGKLYCGSETPVLDCDNLALMKSGAILAAVVGILMFGAIRAAGTIARKRRTLLLLLFAPGLHLTMLLMSGLMVLYAALGMATIYYVESALINRIHIGVMLALGLGAIVGVISLIRAQFSTLRKAHTTALGKPLDREHQPRLWSFVEKLADGMGAQRPQTIVAGLEPNFYVTEARVVCLDGMLQGRTMYISLPLCRILSVDEFKAVLGHELGHYKGLDTQFSKRFYPIYRGASQGLLNLASGFSEKGSAGDIVLWPAFNMLSYFLNCFSVAENEISRERELGADREAANVVSAKCTATALVKVHAFSAVWPVIRKHMKDVIGQGKVLTNASAFFATVIDQSATAEALQEVSEEGPLHPTDTHPPLSARLRNINLSLEQVIADTAITSPQPSAISLVQDPEVLEAELTEIEQAVMIKSGEATVPDESAVGAATP